MLVPDADTSYAGWVRLGLFEQSFYHSDNRNYGRPDKSVLRWAAIVGTEIDGTGPKRAVPAPPGEIGSWWFDIPPRDAYGDARGPQLIHVGEVSDWLGRNLALIPPLVLRHSAKLLHSQYGAPIRWSDAHGRAAVVLRTWRVRDQTSGPEGHSTLGCDLLMRADLLDMLEQAYGAMPFKELQQVHVRDA